MPKVNLLRNNFTSGELSPDIYYRTELAQYRNGAKEVLNMLPIVQGGIKRRSGTQVLSTAVGGIRLIPFIVSHTANYILVFKHEAVDVYTPDGTLITTLASPYIGDDIPQINYCQNRYSLWLTHPQYPVQWIRVSEDLTTWALDPFVFDVPPLEEVNYVVANVALKPSGIDAGTTITLTASDYPEFSMGIKYYSGDRVVVYSGPGGSVVDFYECLLDTIGNDTSTVYWSHLSISTATVFTAADIGKYIFINAGVVRITGYTDPHIVSGYVLQKLTSAVQAIAKAWVLKDTVFTLDLGYPRAVTFFKQRLVLAGTTKYPNLIWFSRAGDETNFLSTVDDSDSFTVAAASDQLTNILHLSQSRGVVVHTGGSELLVTSTGALTPTSVSITEYTSYGSTETIRPIKVGSELLFIQRGSQRLRTLAYSLQDDGLTSNELSILSSHIGINHTGFKELVYQQEPQSIVWSVMLDGTVASLTFNKEQSVSSWATHDLGGTVLSVLTLPTVTGSDRLYFLIDRGFGIQIEELVSGLLLDTATSVPVTSGSITHALVSQLADTLDAYYINGDTVYQVPIRGRLLYVAFLDIDPAITEIYIGRSFTSRVSILPLDLSQSPTTSLTSKVKLDTAQIFLYKSMNPIINGELVELDTFDPESPLAPPKVFTGFKRVDFGGWSDLSDFEFIIEQDKPLPLHIQGLVLELTANER